MVKSKSEEKFVASDVQLIEALDKGEFPFFTREPVRYRISKYDGYTSSPTVSGSGIVQKWRLELAFDGHEEIVPDGEYDLYQQIQAHALSCDINWILTQFANGDEDALNRAMAFYADIVDVPSDINSMKNTVMDAERLFYSLPADIKSKFENNPGVFYAMVGTESFNEVFSNRSAASGDNASASSQVESGSGVGGDDDE
uniref:Internal scaffolding protein n=1 Tax=Dulem virus 117 TaxID=3145594 RepID=A0AAU8AZH7_9VIRU